MADQRLGEPEASDALVDFGRPQDTSRDAHRNRRALWISLASVVALGAVAVPITLHFTHRDQATLHTPDRLAGLTLDNASDAKNTADYLRSAIAAGMDLTTSVGAVYTDGATTANADAHSVIFVGGTAKGSDDSLITKVLALMDDSTDGITGIKAEASGAAGGTMKCGLTTDTSTADAGTDSEMAVCAFADSGDVGIALFPNRTVTDAASLLRQMRSGIQ
jgi:hypothetical protein